MKAKIWKTQEWIKWENTDKEIINQIEKIIKKSNFTILGQKSHFFKPQGATKIWLLAESHCAIHTFPERKKVYIDLSSCNENKQKKFNKIFYKIFEITKEDT